MRPLLILFIVIGHTFAIYGGSASWYLPTGIEGVVAYRWFNGIFIAFTLQAFVFISGYLLAYTGEGTDVRSYLWKKCRRLVIPTVIFGLGYWFIIDSGRQFEQPLEFVVYLFSGPGHLWFLPMLFLCFVASWWFVKLGLSEAVPLGFVVLLMVYGLSLFVPDTLRIGSACRYFIFFMLGYGTYRHRQLLKRLSWPWMVITGGLTVVCICAKIWLDPFSGGIYTLLRSANFLVTGLAGSYFVLLVCFHAGKFRPLVLFGGWGGFFGIYLVHQFVLKYLYYHTDLLVDMNRYLVPWVALSAALLVSYSVVALMLRWKPTRQLI